MTAKKVYYLACAFCRWTSRDIGLQVGVLCVYAHACVHACVSTCVSVNNSKFRLSFSP